MAGSDINMTEHRIFNPPNPELNSEPITKEYADTHYSDGSGSGAKADKRDIGPQRPKGNKGDTGPRGNTGSRGPKRNKGDQGQGTKGDKGDTGRQGSQGPQRPKGDKGDSNSSGRLSNSGFTMQGNMNMAKHRIINLPDPTRPTEPVTKRYVKANFNRGVTADGFTMRDHISMGGHEIVNLAPNPSAGTAAVSKNYTDRRYFQKYQDVNLNNHKVYGLSTPTNNNDAAAKKCVDDKKCVFKDGSTTTLDIDLRSDGFYDDVTFNAGAFCQDFTSTSHEGAIGNKNTFGNGTLNNIKQHYTVIGTHVTMVLQGEPSNYTLVYKDPTVLPPVTFKSYASGVELTASFSTDLPAGIYKYEFDLMIILRRSKTLNVFLYGECGETGYDVSTNYKNYSSSSTTFTKHTQNNASGGYFHKGSGKLIQIYRGSVINYGRSYALSEDGASNEFLLQRLVAHVSEPRFFGKEITWLFENEGAGSAIDLKQDSYFYIEKVQTI